MQISVDAGSLCAPASGQFGTFQTTKNILQALSTYDTENDYIAYTFKKVHHEIFNAKNLHQRVLRPSFGWMAARVSFEEAFVRKDWYLGLNQAIPWFTHANVISLLHGLSFYHHKELYPVSFEALKDQVLFAVSRSKHIIVSSEKVKNELAETFRFKNANVLPFGIPFDILQTKSKKSAKKPYFLFVGMNHRIKNVDFIVSAFKIFREHHSRKDFELILVGDHRHLQDEKLGIKSVSPSREELIHLYQHATGYLTASLYESFNLPVLESLALGTAVVGKPSAIIPELEPYVITAEHLEDFVSSMIKLVSQRTVVNTAKLEKEFSWRNFAEKLVGFYSI